MKRNFYIMSLLLVIFFVVSASAGAGACDLRLGILNQDPYPAVPGEKLEVVFTVGNIDSTDCGEITFEVLDGFPFKVAQSSKSKYTIQSGTFTKDYNTQKQIPVDFVVDPEAIDGSNPLEVRAVSSESLSGFFSERFDVEVEDVRADFEVFVSDYNYATKDITFEVLNVGKSDVEAVTVEVEKQDGVKINGKNIENIGDLSSNEDTSAEFNLDISKDKINLIITYSDSVQIRREVKKEVNFDSSLFEGTIKTNDTNYTYWIVGFGIVVILGYLFFRKKKKK